MSARVPAGANHPLCPDPRAAFRAAEINDHLELMARAHPERGGFERGGGSVIRRTLGGGGGGWPGGMGARVWRGWRSAFDARGPLSVRGWEGAS